ncbi:MAG: DUF4249 domain-containing protein [Saprospiraceae bacterium]|nr:DUF4249 domain-containing protein [Saprospiraceae bacterium]MDW8230575.1 DUF4249 domain-containing protein [Saprospiraceae bacterium]
MKYLPHILLFVSALALLGACNLEKEIDLELPLYDRQPVVECYLEPGKPFRLLLTRSYGFFDPLGLDSTFIDKTLVNGAVVTIAYNGQVDTLYNFLTAEFMPLKIFNYTGLNLVPATPGVEYTLRIVMPDGKEITGRTTMLPKVPIDSIRVEWNPQRDTLARVLTYITDDRTKENFYRRMINYATLDSLAAQDFLTNDRIAQTEIIAFGTGYDLRQGDTVINTIFHITKDYYDYLESVQLAVFGNLNPFAQPARIKSNVSGSANPLGIFTCLVYDRDTTIIRK